MLLSPGIDTAVRACPQRRMPGAQGLIRASMLWQRFCTSDAMLLGTVFQISSMSGDRRGKFTM
ncbi:hypothetical protein D3C71_2059840 [compost metagenome]